MLERRSVGPEQALANLDAAVGDVVRVHGEDDVVRELIHAAAVVRLMFRERGNVPSEEGEDMVG